MSDSNAKKELQSKETESFDSSGSGSSEDDGGGGEDGSRKRKAASEPPTAAEEAAATATLMSLPQKLSRAKKETSVSGDASSKDRSLGDEDLSTIEGQQLLNPNMSIEEARFQVR